MSAKATGSIIRWEVDLSSCCFAAEPRKPKKADIRKAEAMAKAMGRKRKGEITSRVKERRETYAAAGDEPVITDEDLIFTPFDAADYLERESSQIALLRDAFESSHAPYVANAIGAVARARARGLSGLERETGIKRQTLNKSLSLKGNLTLETMMTVLGALGLKLKVVEDRTSGASRRRD
jgi:probable addiction module antidote protein